MVNRAKTLLLAEESSTIRRIVELTFADTEIRVEPVSDRGQLDDGIARADVLLIDASFAGRSGRSLCRELKRSTPQLPIVLLSSPFDDAEMRHPVEGEVDGQLRKPFESAELRIVVGRLLDRGSSPDVAVEIVATQHGVEEVEPQSVEAADSPSAVAEPAAWSAEQVDAVARRMIELWSAQRFEQLGREVLTEVAERVVRERIRQIESDES